MPVDIIDALTKLAHELAPWAVTVSLLANLWNSWRSKEYGKKNAEKLEEVHKTVNGRVEQLISVASQAAKREGYDQGKLDTEQVQHVGKG